MRDVSAFGSVSSSTLIPVSPLGTCGCACCDLRPLLLGYRRQCNLLYNHVHALCMYTHHVSDTKHTTVLSAPYGASTDSELTTMLQCANWAMLTTFSLRAPYMRYKETKRRSARCVRVVRTT